MIFSIAMGIVLAWILLSLLEVLLLLILGWFEEMPTGSASPGSPPPPPPPPLSLEELRCSPARRSPEEQAAVDALIAKLRGDA